MLGNVAKFVLFLLSYSPLLMFIIYHNLNNGDVIFVCMFIFVILLSFSYFFISRVKKYNPQNVTFESISSPSKEAIVLHTVIYLLPFATMNFEFNTSNIPNYYILVTSLLVIGYSFIRYGLIHVNPILALIFRYSIYEVRSRDTSFFLLSKKNINSIKLSEKIDVLQMADLLYIEYEQ